jgi:DNA repair exonuclease SbcCD ATPase subunit
MEELMKVPDEVIIKQLQDEVKALRKKNHKICEKAKEREKRWKAYAESLENAIANLESKDEEIKAVRREVKAQKKVNEDYQILLHSHNLLVKKHTELKQKVQELTAKIEGKPVAPTEEKMKNIRKRFAKLKDRKEIMLGMGFPYDESSPIAYNEVVFLEWAKNNGKWEDLHKNV